MLKKNLEKIFLIFLKNKFGNKIIWKTKFKKKMKKGGGGKKQIMTFADIHTDTFKGFLSSLLFLDTF